MTLTGYLVLKKHNYYKLSARFVTKTPSLSANEIAVKMECEIPPELFTRPQLKFKIDIPQDAIPKKEINAEVVGNIQELIKQGTGIDVRLISETE